MRHQKKMPNILLITMDAVRADRLSLYGYSKNTTPNLSEISKESTVFADAISNAPWTLPSIASILTGLYPSEHGATQENLRLSEEVRTISEILCEVGYETIGISSNAWICDSTGLSRGFVNFKDWRSIRVTSMPFNKSFSKLGDRGFSKKLLQYSAAFYAKCILRKDDTTLILQYIKNYLLKKKQNSKPFFLFLNLLDSHLPYNPYFQEMFLSKQEIEIASGFKKDILERRDKYMAGIKSFSDEEIDVLSKLYDSAIFFLDDRIGDLVDCLRDTDTLENTLLIVTADHGENIGDHGLIGHQLCLYDSLIKVPLIMRFPPYFPKNTIIQKQVETKDIFYTILDIVENCINKCFEDSDKMKSIMRTIQSDENGRPAFGECPKPVHVTNRIRKYTETIPSKYKCKSMFIRKDNYKYIWYEDAPEELYDLNLDPKENNNIINKIPDKRAEMKKLLDEKMKELTDRSSSKGYDKRVKDMDSEIRDRLRVLGYLE